MVGEENLLMTNRPQNALHETASQEKHLSLSYISADARPMQPCYIGQTAPHTAFNCGEQVPDVALPHYKDARMQHSLMQCPHCTQGM